MKTIHAESYIRTENGLLSIEDLPPKDREKFACWLKEAYLNELFRGQGKVFPETVRKLFFKTKKS